MTTQEEVRMYVFLYMNSNSISNSLKASAHYATMKHNLHPQLVLKAGHRQTVFFSLTTEYKAVTNSLTYDLSTNQSSTVSHSLVYMESQSAIRLREIYAPSSLILELAVERVWTETTTMTNNKIELYCWWESRDVAPSNGSSATRSSALWPPMFSLLHLVLLWQKRESNYPRYLKSSRKTSNKSLC